MKNKILITGASSGIGEQLTRVFSETGNDLILSSRNVKKLYYIKNKYESNGVNIDVLECDVSSNKNCKILADFANKEKINVLVNNAGIACPGIKLSNILVSEISNIINVNLKAPILLCKLIKGLETIINMNSIVGIEHKLNRTIYSASKWGLRGFSESLKLESSALIMDVYLSRVKTKPEFKEGLEVDFVANQIYNAFQAKETELILDGRDHKY